MPKLHLKHPDGREQQITIERANVAGFTARVAADGFAVVSSTPTRAEESDDRHAEGEAQHNALLDLLTAKGILTSAEATTRKRKAAR
jgi:hypothetical protein